MAEQILGVDPTRVSATAEHTLGQEAIDPRVNDFPGNVIKYVRAAGTIPANGAVRRDETASAEPNAVLATSATGQIIAGIAITAMSSSASNNNLFGWITTHGKRDVLTLAVAAANTMLTTTATAGTLDDLATNTDLTLVGINTFAGVPVVSVDSTAATDGVLECYIG